MLDFLMISTRSTKRSTLEVYPKFIIKKSSDLMIRGGDFYAIWIEELRTWSTDEQDALQLIDNELDKFVENNKDKFDSNVKVLHMWDADSGMIDNWHKYCQRQLRDNYHMLDEKLIFSNDKTVKRDYASKHLNYPLEPCDTPYYNELMSKIYDPDEREKIEWAIGSIITGDSKKIQKFMVLYGAAGTGKSTVLNIIQKLFDGYYSVFDAKALGSSSNAFALEAFKANPLVAIQHDGDLSRIEDNTRLNSLVSHELMTVNEKFKSTYTSKFKCFLFMGTNKPVKITDAKSGLIRRLIDVSPSGNKLPVTEYKKAMKNIDFELGGIACRCRDIYLADPGKYDDYIPINMLGASNDFYNFVLDSFMIFNDENGTTLKAAWDMYKNYCDEAKVSYPLSQRVFKEELKNYFEEYVDRFTYEDGTRVRSYYHIFKKDKFEENKPKKKKSVNIEPTLIFKEQHSLFDDECCSCMAQYATADEVPSYKWDNVKTKLKDIDTSKLHYVKVPENHIVIDFDIPDENGNKCFEKNLAEASKWPITYAELSKSGAGIHLHYIYTGDPTQLSKVYDEHIEIKVFTGKSSLRRKLTKCNDIPIKEISSGLPLKGEKKMINFANPHVNFIKKISNDAYDQGFKYDITPNLKELIIKCLNKNCGNVPPYTAPNVSFIKKILDDAYDQGFKYDVTPMRNAILAFAASSTHQADYCVGLVAKMKFRSKEPSDPVENKKGPLIFFDCEVFPNLLVINWKAEGDKNPVVRMINPKPQEVEDICKYRLVGFNCRRYDNHILYARTMGYSNEQLFKLSQNIITKGTGFFKDAYNISYTDVYDFSTQKMSLKKFEIELGIHHQELGLPWDQPVQEKLWTKVAEYCDNDVIATEKVFNSRRGDFIARQIQVDLVKKLHDINNVTVNDTTNALSGKIIFGKNRNPQSVFNWRDLSQPVSYKRYSEYREKFGKKYKFRVFNAEGLPEYRTYDGKEVLPDGYSILPFFPGYEFKSGKSTYLGQEIGEGGRVYSEPGMYTDIWDGDVSSMHPHSIIYEALFGPEYTKIFREIVEARVAIKHKDFDAASKMLDGCLKPYLNEEQAKDLAQALKIVINSIYGLTSASFDTAFRDKRNVDNIVAKRGALFMTLLKQEVEKRGYQVAHIKTDSIKIPNADESIKDFVIKFGKEYGYSFETEAEFTKFCLVNDAVYIAKERSGEWTATGTQFQVPYVYKTLFTHEPIEFKDLCETKQVTSALYLDMNEGLAEGEHNYHFIGKIGQFCPMKPGAGGGVLYREKDGKYSAATGTKGYLWMESEMVKVLHKENDINKDYYNRLVDEAVDTISQFGDFEWFANSNDDFIVEADIIKSDELPKSFNLN